MKKIVLVLIIGLLFQNYNQANSQSKAEEQHFLLELFGFKLGQFREAAKTELGQPFEKGKFEDGFIYEVFLLKPDSSLHIIFEYSPVDTNLVWSIQVSGDNSTADLGFRNLKLCTSKEQIEQILGKASKREDIGEYGERWVYDKTNFSVEVNTKGKLSSIKILDNSYDLFPKQDLNKLPTFDNIQKTLITGSNDEILNLLSGDVEIYYKNETYSFQKSFITESKTDYSKLISIIREISNDLKTVNTKNDKDYMESMRLVLGQDSKHVMKFGKKHKIKEIVFKYFGGRYLIYEINANK